MRKSVLNACLIIIAAFAARGAAQTEVLDPHEIAAQAAIDSEGDLETAVRELKLALTTVPADQLGRPLKKLTSILRKLGRADDARSCLEPYRTSPAPLGAEVAKLLREMEQAAKADAIEVPFERWLLDLDSAEYAKRSAVHSELSSLGEAAVPAVAGFAKRLGPIGFREAIAFLVNYPNDDVIALFDWAILDPEKLGYPTIIAANSLARLPNEPRLRLAELAMKSRTASVRGSAAQVLMSDPATRERALAEAEALLAHASPTHAMRAFYVISGVARGSDEAKNPRLLALIDRGLADPRKEVAVAAGRNWASLVAPDEEDAFLAALAALPRERVNEGMIASIVYNKRPWLRVLVRALAYRDLAETAAAELLKIGQKVDAKDLLPAITSIDPRVSRQAVRVLALATGREAVEVAKALVNESDDGIRIAAVRYLAANAPDALVALSEQVLTSGNLPYVAPVLAVHGDAASVAVACRLMKTTSSDPSCQAIVIQRSRPENLADILDIVVVPWRMQTELRREVAISLRSSVERWFAPEHADLILRTIPKMQAEAADAFLQLLVARAHPSMVEPVRTLMTTMTPLLLPDSETSRSASLSAGTIAADPQRTMIACMSVLRKIGGADAAAALMPFVDHPNQKIRGQAVWALLDMKDADTRGVCAKILADPTSDASLLLRAPVASTDPELRKLMMARLLRPNGEGGMSKLLTNGGDGLTNFLAKLGVEEASALLDGLVQAFGPIVRDNGSSEAAALSQVVDCVARHRSNAAIPALAHALTIGAPAVRATAVRGLGSIFTLEAGTALVEGMRDSDPTVRTAAKEGLQALQDYLQAKADWQKVRDGAQGLEGSSQGATTKPASR